MGRSVEKNNEYKPRTKFKTSYTFYDYFKRTCMNSLLFQTIEEVP
jgi:hypothetical protein